MLLRINAYDSLLWVLDVLSYIVLAGSFWALFVMSVTSCLLRYPSRFGFGHLFGRSRISDR